jgi:hypothetical protein
MDAEAGEPKTDAPPNVTSNDRKAEASWKTEAQEIPKNNLVVVFAGLMACVFLAALDQVRWCSLVSQVVHC